MPDINKPLGISELDPKPPINGKVRLSLDMQQTLALLTAYGVNERKVLKCSESGVLSVASARIIDIVPYTGSGANDTQKGDNIPCTEVLVMGHPDNTDKVWVRPYKTATVDNAWPLSKTEVVSFTLDNLNQLNMLFVVDGEKCIVAYTR